MNEGLKAVFTACITGILMGSMMLPLVNPEDINLNITISNSNIRSNNGNNTLYVGGSGPNNYTRIQDAIDNASSGDTVFVYTGIYYENNIFINVTINLIGKDKETTIIDANQEMDALFVFADSVNISGFTIQNTSRCGIYLTSNYTNISNNIFTNNAHGIHPYLPNFYTVITENLFHNNTNGLTCVTCAYARIHRNTAKNNFWGIRIFNSGHCDIFHNNISHNQKWGIYLYGHALNNTIRENNFIENYMNAYFVLFSYHNNWRGNYWNQPLTQPKPIIGCWGLFIPNWINFDWQPATEPYRWWT